jgi:uncharacterized membrane protein YdcZ (DUF606 family)
LAEPGRHSLGAAQATARGGFAAPGGVGIIALAIVLAPELGAATVIALLIIGQMIASTTFDRFGWLTRPPGSAAA